MRNAISEPSKNPDIYAKCVRHSDDLALATLQANRDATNYNDVDDVDGAGGWVVISMLVVALVVDVVE